MKVLMLVVMVLGCRVSRAEVSCFRTPAQAAVQVGQQEGGGYRLVFVRADALSGRTWASVRSCVHPEWPAVVVAGPEVVLPHLNDAKAVVEMGHPAVGGGKRVRVIEADAAGWLETIGVTQSPGRVGDRIAVRLRALADGEGQVVMAVVRSAEMVEIDR